MKKLFISLFTILLVLPVTVNAAETYPSLYNTIKSGSQGKAFASANDTYTGITEFTEKGEIVYVYTGYNDSTNKSVDNYAVIGNLCFRILRTTYTEGVKLAYYGKYENGKCDTVDNTLKGAYHTSNDDPKYVGYMNNNDTQNSNIKATIDEWYSTKLMDYTSWFEDAIYCNDRTGHTSYGYTEDDAYTFRSYNSIGDITLTCPQNYSYTVKNADGNKKLTYPVATISADEALLTKNAKYSWLTYDFEDNYYTMTPSSYTPVSGEGNFMYVTEISDYGWYPYDTGFWESHFLPVVSVNKNIYVKDGDGTKPDPYILTDSQPEPDPEPEEKEVIKGSDKVEENPPTGIYNYIWVLPIIICAGYVVYTLIKNKSLFKGN